MGINNGTFIRGQFVIGSGTGGLADLNAQGSFSSKAGVTLNYTLKWHIEPAAVMAKHSA